MRVAVVVYQLGKSILFIYTFKKGTSRQISGKGAIRKRFPLHFKALNGIIQ